MMVSAARRDFLTQGLGGLGLLALQSLCHARTQSPHAQARAKSIIYLYMEGGPSQVDTFDYKPKLQAMDGQPLPFDKPSTVFNSSNRLMASPFRFSQYGESGTWVSELLPHLAQCVDDMTFVHSMHHDVSNHSAGCYMTHTGDPVAGRPSMGSWISYGLGSESDDLPGFVVLDCGQGPSGGAPTWSSGFLPAKYAGVKFLPGDVTVEFLDRQEPSEQHQQRKLNAIREMFQIHASEDPRLEAVIAGHEKAARMQTAVPELMSLDTESKSTRRLYGMDEEHSRVFGSRCLLARRLVERGVRCVEVFSPRVKADRWDQHSNLEQGHRRNCLAVDQPIAGLIQDLKQRGMLDDTIVLWGGEFGRTPTTQGGTGRDHNPFGYTVFMAGGGFQPGYHYGATDEFGYYAMQNKVHLHDLHATLLHQMGIDHERLTYRFGGRDYRLTDVRGRVIQDLLA